MHLVGYLYYCGRSVQIRYADVHSCSRILLNKNKIQTYSLPEIRTVLYFMAHTFSRTQMCSKECGCVRWMRITGTPLVTGSTSPDIILQLLSRIRFPFIYFICHYIKALDNVPERCELKAKLFFLTLLNNC